MVPAREDVLGYEDGELLMVTAPRLKPGTLFAGVMSGEERARFRRLGYDPPTPEGKLVSNDRYEAVLMVFSARDAEGNRLFTEADLPTVQKKNWKLLEAFALVAQKVNLLGAEWEQEALKNS